MWGIWKFWGFFSVFFSVFPTSFTTSQFLPMNGRRLEFRLATPGDPALIALANKQVVEECEEADEYVARLADMQLEEGCPMWDGIFKVACTMAEREETKEPNADLSGVMELLTPVIVPGPGRPTSFTFTVVTVCAVLAFAGVGVDVSLVFSRASNEEMMAPINLVTVMTEALLAKGGKRNSVYTADLRVSNKNCSVRAISRADEELLQHGEQIRRQVVEYRVGWVPRACPPHWEFPPPRGPLIPTVLKELLVFGAAVALACMLLGRLPEK